MCESQMNPWRVKDDGENVRDTRGESAVTRVVLSGREDFSVGEERRLDPPNP